MFFLVVFVVMAGIAAAAVFAGIQEQGNKARRNGGQPLTSRQKVNLAKAAGVMPNRKEN